MRESERAREEEREGKEDSLFILCTAVGPRSASNFFNDLSYKIFNAVAFWNKKVCTDGPEHQAE